jgi:hypothetical protein
MVNSSVVNLPLPKKLFNGHWQFPEQMGDAMGFIYLIRDDYMEKFYLGKKLFKGTGKLNQGVESKWREYTSSSKLLKELFQYRPKEEFSFICLEQYQTKGTLAYAETWTLCHVEAPTNNRWYNKRIEKISWSVREPISQRHKDRLRAAINFEEVK